MKGQYPYYGASGIIDYVNDYIFDENIILLGEDGENILSRNLPLAFKVSGKCWVNNHAHVIKPNLSTNIDFLTQYLDSISYVKYNTGTAQPKLNQEVCRTIPLNLPSLPEQTKIANFLTAIDEKITQLTQKHDLLKQYKKGVMQQIFSQQLRFRDEDGREFAGWEEKELKDIAYINPKTDSLPDKFVYIDLESVEKGVLLKETAISKNKAPSRAQRLLKEEDVLFQMVRPYQRNNLFFNKVGSYVASTGYAQIRAHENSRFLYHYLHLDDFNTKVMNRCTGTSYPAINSNDLALISIQLPSKKEQTKIANFLTAIDDKITHTKTQLDAVKLYKKGLLQQMFV